jgi:hypothetical protein
LAAHSLHKRLHSARSGVSFGFIRRSNEKHDSRPSTRRERLTSSATAGRWITGDGLEYDESRTPVVNGKTA